MDTIPNEETAQKLSHVAMPSVIKASSADVGKARKRRYRHRLILILSIAIVGATLWWLWDRFGDPSQLPLPSYDAVLAFLPVVFFVLLIVIMLGSYLVTSRSPHEIITPDQIATRLDDVVGIDVVKQDVIRSLNLFLAHKTFTNATGGNTRRGLLFEGPPGTGKTYTAKAIAAEAGVPFLFASATSFQSSFYGATSRKIRSFFSTLRKIAEQEGGAIAFIDEFDAIGATRRGMEFRAHIDANSPMPTCAVVPSATAHSFGTADVAGPVVNELLVQMQSFDTLRGSRKFLAKLVDKVNLLLPLFARLPKPHANPGNILVIASTNRAESLDPALLRPGRFDRRLSFDLPDRAGRRSIIDYYLTKKTHTSELDTIEIRDALAALTGGYSPVMLEHLFDEGLIHAISRGETAMTWSDVQQARLDAEIGLGQPVSYTDHEKQLISTHEAGHCVVAWLLAPQRRLDVLTIIKRRSALGLLAHSDREDVYTRSRSELKVMIAIAMGGQCAEEIFFGDVSTGPAGDLQYATSVAAQMVGSAGMTGSLVSFLAAKEGSFSDGNLVSKVLGDSAGRVAVEQILQEQKMLVQNLLRDNRHLVQALRDALMERHELIGSQITDVLSKSQEAARTAPDMK